MSTTVYFLFFIPLLSIILLTINFIFAPDNPYQEKDTPFECGFNSFLWQNRTQFSISFFIFALLFLLFDLEILLVYPYIVSAYTNSIYGLVIMLIFFIILTLGFAFELGKKALFIENKQIIKISKKNFKLFENPEYKGESFLNWYWECINTETDIDSEMEKETIGEKETQIQKHINTKKVMKQALKKAISWGGYYFFKEDDKRVSVSKQFVKPFSKSARYYFVPSEKDKQQKDKYNKLRYNSLFKSFLYYIYFYRYLIYSVLSIAFIITFTILNIELIHVYDIGILIFYPGIAYYILTTHYKDYKYYGWMRFLKYICHCTFYTSILSICWVLLFQWPVFIVY